MKITTKQQQQLKKYQIGLFDKIYSYLKTNLENELEIENQTEQFKIKWLKTWLELKEKFEKKI